MMAPSSSSITTGLRSFRATDQFLAEVAGSSRRPAYVLLGDEGYLLERCRAGVLDALVPGDLREFCLHELELGPNTIFEALDLAQTPSLIAPFQVLWVRGLKTLYGRGQKKEEFGALEAYLRSPNPQALLVLVADHIALPQDVRTMEMTDKERAERIRETLGEYCGIVELQRVSAEDASAWAQRSAKAAGCTLEPDAAQELIDSLGGSGGSSGAGADMLALASELEKLMLYAGAMGSSTLGLAEVEAMVPSAKQRSLYELTDAISQKDSARALSLLHGLLNASDGGEDAAIGHIFLLAKTYRQMLVLQEKQVKDQRSLWQVLWPGFRVAPFAADALIAQTRRYRSRQELSRGLEWIAKADQELRSGPVDKRLVLERLVLRLTGKIRDSALAEA